MNYGDIDIYAAKGREPGVASFDFVSLESRDLVVLKVSYFMRHHITSQSNELFLSRAPSRKTTQSMS